LETWRVSFGNTSHDTYVNSEGYGHPNNPEVEDQNEAATTNEKSHKKVAMRHPKVSIMP
jgi:hypothetical protein